MKKIIPVIILIIISTLLIFYSFTDIPKYLAYDEVEFAKLALSLDGKPYIAYSQMATGHSTLYFYILLFSLKLFGVSTFALRLPAAIFGVLSVLIFYLILKKLFKENTLYRQDIALSLPIIFLTSHWFLNFTRFSFEATFLLFLELLSIYYLLKFDENSNAKIPNFLRFNVFRQKISVSSIFIALSGLFAGFAFLSYTPGRIFFILPLFFILVGNKGQAQDLPLHGTMKQWNNETIKRLLYFLIPFVIIITPLMSYLMTNKDTRIDQQFFLMNHEMPVNEKISGLWQNISTTALMFNLKGDVNGRHNYPNKPALNPILGVLFVIGLIQTMKQWNNRINQLFLIYFFISLLPALMTYPWENPNMLRTYTVLPSIVYFIGNAIYYLGAIASRLLLSKRIPKYWILNTIYLILILSCFYELRTYFKYQSIVFKQAFEIKLPLKKAIKSQPQQ